MSKAIEGATVDTHRECPEHVMQAYDKKLTEVEAQRASLEAQRAQLQQKLRDLASVSAEEQAKLKAQYLVRHSIQSNTAVEVEVEHACFV